jgi:hypothetical protein
MWLPFEQFFCCLDSPCRIHFQSHGMLGFQVRSRLGKGNPTAVMPNGSRKQSGPVPHLAVKHQPEMVQLLRARRQKTFVASVCRSKPVLGVRGLFFA